MSTVTHHAICFTDGHKFPLHWLVCNRAPPCIHCLSSCGTLNPPMMAHTATAAKPMLGRVAASGHHAMRFIPATMCRRNRCCAVRPQPALQPQSHCLKWQQPPVQQQQRQQPRQQGRRRPKQQHLIIVSDNFQQGARHSLVCAASSADGSSSSSPQEPQQQPPKPQGGLAAWFDRLPPQVQLGAIGAVAFVGLVRLRQLTRCCVAGLLQPPTASQAAAPALFTPICLALALSLSLWFGGTVGSLSPRPV
jgi:hypothetical protein